MEEGEKMKRVIQVHLSHRHQLQGNPSYFQPDMMCGDVSEIVVIVDGAAGSFDVRKDSCEKLIVFEAVVLDVNSNYQLQWDT